MGELQSSYVPTKIASLRWINALLEKVPVPMKQYIEVLLPGLLKTLSDDADAVVLLVLQVLSRISLTAGEFPKVLNAILMLFANDRRLLEVRGSLVIRKVSEDKAWNVVGGGGGPFASDFVFLISPRFSSPLPHKNKISRRTNVPPPPPPRSSASS